MAHRWGTRKRNCVSVSCGAGGVPLWTARVPLRPAGVPLGSGGSLGQSSARSAVELRETRTLEQWQRGHWPSASRSSSRASVWGLDLDSGGRTALVAGVGFGAWFVQLGGPFRRRLDRFPARRRLCGRRGDPAASRWPAWTWPAWTLSRRSSVDNFCMRFVATADRRAVVGPVTPGTGLIYAGRPLLGTL